MLRTRTSRWTMGTAVLCMLLLVVAWLLLISPRRSRAADLDGQNAGAQQENRQLQLRIENLRAQAAQLPTYRAELAGILRQLPPTAAMPQFLRDLDSLAASSGVTVNTFTPSGSSALKATAGAGTGAGGAGGASGTKPAGVVQMPLAIVARGDYFQAVAFVQKLQTQLSRAFLISGVQVAQGSSGTSGEIQLSLTGFLFAWPAGAELASTTPATPSAAAGATATASATIPATTPAPAPATTVPTSVPTSAAVPVTPTPASTSATTGGTP